MEDSVFTQIVTGKIPCHKVYEDDKTLAFLDIHPVTPGMTLVIPKVQVANFEDLDDDTYMAMWATVKKVALKQRAVFPEAKKISVQIDGFDIKDHAHVKVLPLGNIDVLHPDPSNLVDPDYQALTVMAERLHF